jgi:hypothetical protein
MAFRGNLFLSAILPSLLPQLNSTTPLRPSTHHSPRTHPIFNAPPPHRALPSAPLLHHVHDSDGRHHARQGTITTSYTSLMSYILTSTPARPRIHPNNPDNPQRLTQTCPPRRNGRLDFQRDPFPVCPPPVQSVQTALDLGHDY